MGGTSNHPSFGNDFQLYQGARFQPFKDHMISVQVKTQLYSKMKMETHVTELEKVLLSSILYKVRFAIIHFCHVQIAR